MAARRALAVLLLACAAVGFAPAQQPARAAAKQTQLRGIMDIFKGAFSNQAFDDRRTKASHILVATEETANEVMAAILGGQTFGDAARAFSTCPSGKSGGSLGTFEPGKMVAEFDKVCFDETVPVGVVVGPVKTQFGYHLIRVDDRFKNTVKSDGSSVF
mmetsp:Transcript_32129/g.108154  ORF Transcript_32129/g.108154 Transcript_32129/m.108154 type:complete len:159 (+) Transcript_32129:107-583(+)